MPCCYGLYKRHFSWASRLYYFATITDWCVCSLSEMMSPIVSRIYNDFGFGVINKLIMCNKLVAFRTIPCMSGWLSG